MRKLVMLSVLHRGVRKTLFVYLTPNADGKVRDDYKRLTATIPPHDCIGYGR